jgi:hypothetical protein
LLGLAEQPNPALVGSDLGLAVQPDLRAFDTKNKKDNIANTNTSNNIF